MGVVGWHGFVSVAVRRWMMYCMMLVGGLRGCGGWGRRAVVWLGEGAVGSCGWSVVMVVVGWQLVGLLMVFPFGMMGGKYIWMVAWERRRRDFEGRTGRASGGIGSCEAVLGSMGVGVLGRSWSCQISQCNALQSCSVRSAWGCGAGVSGSTCVVWSWHMWREVGREVLGGQSEVTWSCPHRQHTQ